MFLKDTARIYFTDNIRYRVEKVEEALQLLNEQFDDEGARRVNDEFWAERSFTSVQERLVADSQPSRH